MIPSPKLDDRTFHDIVDEAIRMIPRYAPEWTNHNPSDPGITLLELAAWMTDQLIQRINQVPDKNYVAFLNLLGIKLHPPRAATAILQFSLADGATAQRVPAGTAVSTAQASEAEPITFESNREIVISGSRPDRCYSYVDDTYAENSRFVDPPFGAAAVNSTAVGGFEVFGGAQRVERFLYLSDPRFAHAGEAAFLRIFLGAPERGGRDLARLLEWEYWDGTRWRDLMPARVEVERGEVAFAGPLSFQSTTVNHVAGHWMRGRLAEVPGSPEDTEVDLIRARVEVVGDGLPPTIGYVNLDNNAFLPIDFGKNMFPFGKEPKADSTMYLACDELMHTADAYIGIELMLADAGAYPRANPSESLVLAFEYWDGKKWRYLGRSSTRGVLPGAGDEIGFHDETRVLSQPGVVSFRRPKDMEPHELNGETHRWIRVRIEKGDYGEQGTYSLDADKWTFKNERPLAPPVVRAIAIRSREDHRDLRHVLTFNDFHYADMTDVARTEFTIFQPFQPRADESPALYVGYQVRHGNERIGLYFQTEEELGLGSLPSDEAEIITGELARYEEAKQIEWERGHRVEWEYWTGRLWEPLAVNDESDGFASSGFVFFVPPDDWVMSSKFTEDRFWMRARLEMGGYVKPPRLRQIVSNAVDAQHSQTVRDETLGSSDGMPLQTFKLLRGPLLENERIEVRERVQPAADEVLDLGAEAIRTVATGDPGAAPSAEVWVRYKRVDSFFASGPKSRHYTLDYVSGEVAFGDGRRGMVPPEGKNSITATYRIGGGDVGNVNAGTLTSLGRSLAYVDKVANPIAASGGTNRETVDEAKARAPFTIKSRDRAVTEEDFEMLALRASTSLARARCVPDLTHRGHVTLALVPKADVRGEELARRLVPSNEVLRYVKRYLDERKLVGSVLNVVRPRYRDLSLRVVLIRRSVGTSDRIRRDIELKLRRNLHALVGGRDGRGWEFGRPVLKPELVHAVEEVPGVEGVELLELRDELRGIGVEHIRLEEDELPFVVGIQVAEKIRDDIR